MRKVGWSWTRMQYKGPLVETLRCEAKCKELAALNTGKFVKYFGMLFVVLGIVIAVVLAWVGMTLGERGLLLMALLFVAMFCGIGGFFAWYGNNLLHKDDEIIGKGETFAAKVFGYDADPSVTMNGSPLIVLVVRYFDCGEIREARVSTGIVDPTQYPIASTVVIREYEGRTALVPGSCTSARIEGEADLMNPDFDPSARRTSLGVSCPNCGAALTVPVGMSRICPYCSTKVSLDEKGAIR